MVVMTTMAYEEMVMMGKIMMTTTIVMRMMNHFGGENLIGKS